MIVLKFGGSSVAKPDRIKHIGTLLQPRVASGEKIAVVFSAFGGVTDTLINMAEMAAKGKKEYVDTLIAYKERHNQALQDLLGTHATEAIDQLEYNHKNLEELLNGVFLVREASLRTMDYILSFGERNSCYIISEYFKHIGLDSAFLDARNIIKTNKKFGAAQVNFDLTYKTINNYFSKEEDKIQVVTGFIASDIGGLTTTLGRGGSDYTAAILAGALQADRLEIWTDVDGVLTCDPRKVSKAYTVESLSYNEAMELSHFGAKVIYPPTIQPALAQDIPIYIRNTFNPEFPGSRISKEIDEDAQGRIKGMSSMSGICLLTLQGPGMMGIPGIAARFFSSLARQSVNVVMITQGSSEHSICVAIKQDRMKQAINAAKHEFASEIDNKFIQPIAVIKDLTIVAIVGQNMRRIPGVAGRLFSALGKNGVNVVAIAQGSSELNISFAIDTKNELKALNLIHDSFFLSNLKTVNVFMVGVGLIGGTLLEQIKDQTAHLEEKQKLHINITGLANTKKILLNEKGIDLNTWKSDLTKSVVKSDIEAFVNDMISMNLPNSVFVDNTANQSLPEYYKSILSANISISTPNKVANSASFQQYEELKKLAQAKQVEFLYETNVGAGLPVISTMRSLIESGDEIVKIEAVLSGSVSYIFNNFNSSRSFHELVMEAKELGYTEPDPREDLSGSDIKRKILILSREAGYSLEPSDVKVEPILPQSSIDAASVDAFFQTLIDENKHFSTMVSTAEKENKVLRYIASLENGQASVRLQAVSLSSSFHGLQGSDNMIVFTTKRYANRPLVIKGPGAGAEVTAAGVFSEIISIGNKNHFGYN